MLYNYLKKIKIRCAFGVEVEMTFNLHFAFQCHF